ncbi:MAG: polysaccharide biosynthesis/export family protein [Mangrovibacterium sp.]
MKIKFVRMTTAQRFSRMLILLIVLSSCSGSLKNLTYMHGAEVGKIYPEVPLPESYTIKPNDQLFVNVIGEDREQTAFLNMSSSAGMGGSGTDFFLYLVDENGNISYPQLGLLHVSGKTILEVQDLIQKRVDEYIIGTSVQVKLANRTFTVLGDVKSPGLQMMSKNQFTIFEALGSAGDISDYGNRKTVKLIREVPKGKKLIEIDLTDPNLLTSENYYIQPNDVIYVEPNEYRRYSVKTLPWLNQVTLGTSLLTTVLLVLNLLK